MMVMGWVSEKERMRGKRKESEIEREQGWRESQGRQRGYFEGKSRPNVLGYNCDH